MAARKTPESGWDYFVVRPTNDKKACYVEDYPSMVEDFEMPTTGERMGDAYPPDVRLEMSSEFKGILVPDNIPNALGYFLVSQAAKAVLEQHVTGAEIEFLPFSLVNHKGRKSPETAYIANVIGTSDCVDMDATDGSPGTFRDDEFSFIHSLKLDPDRIDAEANLFRLRPLSEMIVVRSDMKEAIEAAKLSGFTFFAEEEDMG